MRDTGESDDDSAQDTEGLNDSERASSETVTADQGSDSETTDATTTSESLRDRFDELLRDRSDESLRDRFEDDRDAWNWVKNAGLQLLTGYGERALRPIGWSVVIIAVFSGVLWPLVGGPMRGFQASLGSFVTLVPASAVGIDDGSDLAIIVAEAEGFLGMFLVAVFVFTLTRSIRR
ncbi:MAG: hypothetical protein J07HX64_01508 [halophilic archaeon J07HX64]|jgi:hypothetical protein|nr:MAG: hypothetical protein J07HX64_01508 [halophilic archaeon J07HX64]